MIVALLTETAQAGDSAELIIATPEEAALQAIIYTPEEAALQAVQIDDYAVNITIGADELTPEMQFGNEVDNTLSLVIVAGTDFVFLFQYRVGETPEVFEPGKWPKAYLRSEKSPRGKVLLPYTITIENEAKSIWALRLTREQTRLLAAQSGITEQSYVDGDGTYQVLDYIRTTIVPKVTQP